MTWRPLVIGILAAFLLSLAAATVTSPQSGALEPDPIGRNPDAGDPSRDPSEPGTTGRPEISLPGIGVSVALPTPDLPAWLQLVLLSLALALVGALVIRMLGRSSRGEELDPVAPDRATVRDEGARAGQSHAPVASLLADANADLENEVYRAWLEMTRVLDVDRPESSTPGEFAEAALAAGANPEDVATLTQAFEAVRYGSRPITTARRQSVAAALKRVRATVRARGEESDTEQPADSQSGNRNQSTENPSSRGGRNGDDGGDSG